DVGDREMVRHEIAVAQQVRLHYAERAVPIFSPVLERMTLQFAAALDQREPEISGADIGLKTMLFEEHPLQGFGARDAVLRRQGRTARDIPENGVRLGEMTVGSYFKQRHLSVGILAQKFRRAALALENVDFDQFVRNAKPGQRKADLVAVA